MTSTIVYQRAFFADTDGKPLDGGKLYIGTANTDPETSPIACYWDSALTTPATQPLDITAGYIVRSGIRAQVYVGVSSYSMRVRNKSGSQVDYTAAVSDFSARLGEAGGSDLVAHTQGGTGATQRTVGVKLREIVTPYDFGAVGDGTTDDTAAVQAALNTTATRVSLPYGSFAITSSVTSSVSGRIIDGPGSITATTAIDTALIVTGDNSVVRVNIAGNSKIGVGIRVANASKPVVENCRITDLYSTTANCAGVYLSETTAGAIVRNNVIRNVNSVGNGSLGDSSGYSRAVAIGYSIAATGETIVENNYIENVIGEEGDAIAAVAGGSGTYYRLDLTVRGNTIRNFTRRAVKTQGYNVRVLNNYFTHDYTSSASVPNAASVVDFVQGGDVAAKGNTFYACQWFTQISMFSVTTDVFSNITIADNTISGLGTTSTNNAISVTPTGSTAVTTGSGLVVRNNVIKAGAGRAISVGKCTSPLISGNVISIEDDAAGRVISLASGAVNAVVTGNILTSGARQSFIANDSTNGVHIGNHVKSNTALFSNAAGGGNHLIAGNSIDGTAADYYDSNSLTGNRWGGSYNFGAQTTNNPAPLSTTTAAGPATSLSGLQVRTGQIVFDTSPTAAGKIGWTATTSGDAASVTWKPFGPIDA